MDGDYGLLGPGVALRVHAARERTLGARPAQDQGAGVRRAREPAPGPRRGQLQRSRTACPTTAIACDGAPARPASSRARCRVRSSRDRRRRRPRRDALHARRLRPDDQLDHVHRSLHAHRHDDGQVPHVGLDGNRRDRAAPSRSRSTRSRRRRRSARRPTARTSRATSRSRSDATDAGSGVSDVELFVDGDWTAYTATARPTSSRSPPRSSALGPHRIKAMVYDALGNNATSPPVTSRSRTACPRRRSPATARPARPTSSRGR